jgi:NAD-dependent SIR2 family protein deacetylase
MATEGGDGRYGLRKRRRTDDAEEPSGLDRLLSAAETASRVVVFSGSGLSATSGMSTFSTRGGLYERAQRQFRLGDGKLLFTYSFFDRNRMDAQSFFADIYLEAAQARAAPGHRALAALHRAGRLRRHYTLNIDGLAEKVGMDPWHPEMNPDGCTVEMHGNVHHLVCTECGGCCPLSETAAQQLRQRQPIPCPVCPPVPPLGQEAEDDAEAVAEAAAAEIGGGGAGEATPPPLRFKVMLYEDAEGEYITPEEVMDLMEEDAKAADLILWVGISFQQSASTAYFRKVRHWLQEAGRSEHVTQVVINPSDEALWNLMTACSNQRE